MKRFIRRLLALSLTARITHHRADSIISFAPERSSLHPGVNRRRGSASAFHHDSVTASNIVAERRRQTERKEVKTNVFAPPDCPNPGSLSSSSG
jgi:hypothetical protein